MIKVSSFSIILIFVCLSLVGLFMIPLLPVKLNPSNRLPEVHISFSMSGQSALVVEMEVTSKIEAMLSRVRGIRNLNSYSNNGGGSVSAKLSKHTDPEYARFEISTIVRQLWPSLPQGVSYPRISMSGMADETEIMRPYLSYTVNAPYSPMDITEYIDVHLKPKLAELPGIDRIDIQGAGKKVYKLEYDYQQLREMGVNVGDMSSAINKYLGREFLGMGRIEDDNGDEQWIRIALLPESSKHPFDPQLIPVKKKDETVIYLSSLVRTTCEEEAASSRFRINGLNSIYLSLTAKENANQLALSKQTRQMLDEYAFPEGYELHLSHDAGVYLKDELNKIYFRSGLTVLILLCFVFLVYRNLKYSLLIMSSLICNLAIAVIFYYLLDMEMQLYSLAGLTISLNLIIDNTIIMSDQIIRRSNKRAFMAILAATCTSIGALVIILFMDERVRANLQEFAWIIMINLAISLFIALFLVPALIEKFAVKQKKKKKYKALTQSHTLLIWLMCCLYIIIIRLLYGCFKAVKGLLRTVRGLPRGIYICIRGILRLLVRLLLGKVKVIYSEAKTHISGAIQLFGKAKHAVDTVRKDRKKALLFLFPGLMPLQQFRHNVRGKRLLVHFNHIYVNIMTAMRRRRGWIITGLIFAFGIPTFLLPEKLGQKRGYYFIMEQPGFWENLYNKTIGSTFYKEKIRPVGDVALGGTMRLFAQKVGSGGSYGNQRSETALNVTASMPNGVTFEQMDAIVMKMEEYLRHYTEIRQFETNIYNGQRASIRILFVKEHQRSGFPYTLKSRIISKSLEIGGGSWQVHGVGDGFDNSIREQAGSSRIKLLGYNYDQLRSLSEKIRDSLLEHRRIKDIILDSRFSWYKTDYTEFVFDADREKLIGNSLLPVHLYGSMSPMFSRNSNGGTWMYEGKASNIRFSSRQAYDLDKWNMERYLNDAAGKEYKLNNIAEIEKRQGPQGIAKEDQQYVLCLQYEYIGSWQQANVVMNRHIEEFNNTAPLGYKAVSETGGWWSWSQMSASQYWLLFLVIAIMFLMTGILFNSLVLPLVVIFIIPVAYIGLFLTFYLFKLSFDQGGFAAFVLLTGISVNASIYILNEYNNLRRKHPSMSRVQAYLKAWNAKVTPIFLTIVSTILGFIPFMIGEYREAFWFPLAAGTTGGLAISFPALFLFLPLFMGAIRKKVGRSIKSKTHIQ
ncbi:MAG: efflux RND transporter permease subunit [Prevotellaceae bacterium]|jgi:multidrug efflux pump subunit AcrB|nr:efflux RND transporter permease subunit [Prevotellaceae bacterium]